MLTYEKGLRIFKKELKKMYECNDYEIVAFGKNAYYGDAFFGIIKRGNVYHAWSCIHENGCYFGEYNMTLDDVMSYFNNEVVVSVRASND